MMESAEELTITTIEAVHYSESEDPYQRARVCFLVRNLCNSQLLLIERNGLLHFEDDNGTIMRR